MDGLLKRLCHDGHSLLRWYYEHFHRSWNAEIDGIDYTMLGIMEMKELRYKIANMEIVKYLCEFFFTDFWTGWGWW